MISLCTVTLDPLEGYFEKHFLESVKNKTTYVDEVLIAKVDADPSYFEEFKIGDIRCIKFGCYFKEYMDLEKIRFVGNKAIILDAGSDLSIQHAVGLHNCFKRAKNNLILTSDPDVVFYCHVDKLYLELMQSYNLDIVGCSHRQSVEYACGFLPNPINLLFDKSKLPNMEFLNSGLKRRPFKINEKHVLENKCFDGMWLIPGAIPEYVHLFPNKNGYFETGCNFWIISQMQKWRWLSFQTTDSLKYSTQYKRCNFKPLPNIKKTNLIYHLNSSYVISKRLAEGDPVAIEQYNNFTKEFKETLITEE